MGVWNGLSCQNSWEKVYVSHFFRERSGLRRGPFWDCSLWCFLKEFKGREGKFPEKSGKSRKNQESSQKDNGRDKKRIKKEGQVQIGKNPRLNSHPSPMYWQAIVARNLVVLRQGVRCRICVTVLPLIPAVPRDNAFRYLPFKPSTHGRFRPANLLNELSGQGSITEIENKTPPGSFLPGNQNGPQCMHLSVSEISRCAFLNGCSFFAYSWKLPAYSGAFCLQLTTLAFLLTI